MPELPEVETTLRGIAPFLHGQTLESIIIRNGSLRWPVSDSLYRIANQTIKDSHRRGKYIVIQLACGAILIHLGMSGNLRVVEKDTIPQKHDHVDLILSSGKCIRYHDPRRFGCVLWTQDWRQHDLIKSLGVEPLSQDFSGDYLYQYSRDRKVTIKQLIMNSKVLVGVGNIYANEALFLSGIDPRRAAGKLSRKRMHSLVSSIKQVLTLAIQEGGTTLKDFTNHDGKPGYFKQQLHVYGRSDEICHQCASRLKTIRQNNRATFYCPTCQT